MRKNKKAQQLVEFVLVAPVLIVILVVIVELGYAINTKITLAEAIKASVAITNQLYNQSSTESQKEETIRNSIENYLKNYFDSHNLPDSDSISVILTRASGSQTAIVTAKYSYKPVFVLPNILGNTIIPAKYTFSSSQVISESLLSASTLNSPLSTLDLSSFGKTAGNLDGRTSALINKNINGIDFRTKLAILLSFKISSSDPSYKYARLFNWWGEDLLPSNLLIDITTGNLVVKTPYCNGGNWIDTQIPYTWVISALGFTQGLYVKTDISFTENPLNVNRRLLLSSPNSNDNLNVSWCDQDIASKGSCDGDISTSSIDNYGKRGLSLLFDNVNDAFGTFDFASWTSTSGINDPKPVKFYIFENNTYNFILRLFLPNNAVKPNDTSNGYKSTFYLNSNGQLATSGTNVVIQDVYLDNDGDFIPNAWDNDPGYIDIDGNKKIDGEQSSISTKFTDLPTNISTSSMSVGSSFDLPLNGNVLCSGVSTIKEYYTVTSNAAITSADLITVPFRTASPFSINGTAKTTSTNTPYIPSFEELNLNKISFQKNTRISGNPCTINAQNVGTFIYYNKNNTLSRKMPTWFENPAPLTTYFYNIATANKEVNDLYNQAFKYKVSQTR